MFDKYFNKILDTPFQKIALELATTKITANQITVMGFFLGIIAFTQVAYGNYGLGLIFILFNRFFDKLDGKVAEVNGITDSGGFLDITLDFIFYSAIPLGFGISHQDHLLAALVLIFSFVTTSSTFLTFSIMAEKNRLKNIDYPNKSFYYLGGITEGSETILFFILFCLFPSWFSHLAYIFAFLCLLTSGFRIFYGFKTLSHIEKEKKDYRKKIYNKIL